MSACEGFRAEIGVLVAIGLGSNLGDRAARLRFGAARLVRSLGALRCSSVYETLPREVEEQPPFLNACCTGRARLGPMALLRELKRIERAAGRDPGGMRFGPRELDLDLLLYGDAVVDRPGLSVPHPRLHERAFALVPLREIAPDWRHPRLGRSIAELAAAVGTEGVKRVAPPLRGTPAPAGSSDGQRTRRGGDAR